MKEILFAKSFLHSTLGLFQGEDVAAVRSLRKEVRPSVAVEATHEDAHRWAELNA